MDRFELATKLVESLAWPIVVVVAIIVFRKDARNGLDRLRKIDAFGVTAEFDELERFEIAVNKAGDEDEKAEPGQRYAGDANLQDPHEEGVRFSLSPAEVSAEAPGITAEAIVLIEWATFERFLRLLHATGGTPWPLARGPSMTTVLTGLVARGTISLQHMEAIKFARQVRDAVAHGARQVSIEEAQRFKMGLMNLRLLATSRKPDAQPPGGET